MALKFLLLLIFLSTYHTQAKVVHCKNKFTGGGDSNSINKLWTYCTKFGTGVPYEMQVSAKAQFLIPYSKHSGAKYKVEVAWYSDY
jgi:hypothetical protein